MKNKVELLGYYGSDEIIACSAWTSTSRELNEDKRSRIGSLIHDLWSKGHETPFEKGVVHFLVDTDIATHIHLLKHRIASINAESARYKELKEDKFYLPEDWSQSEVGQDLLNLLKSHTNNGNALYHKAVAELTPILGRARAKESARFFKSYNTQIQADIMMNMRSFANFQKLRNSPHAQLEIREVAQEMLDLVEGITDQPFKHTLEAFKAA